MSNLIVTCTINTGKCPGVVRNNPSLREEDYFKTITKYLETTDLFLIVVENSGFNFTSWKNSWKDYSDRMEFVFVPNNAGEYVGKGNGEVDSILYALRHSDYFKRPGNDYGNFYKVSGRYYSPDIPKIIQEHDRNNYLIVRDWQPNGNILTVFFGCSVEMFRTRFEQTDPITDNGKIFESHMGDFAWWCEAEGVPYIRIGPMNFVDAICSDGTPFIDK